MCSCPMWTFLYRMKAAGHHTGPPHDHDASLHPLVEVHTVVRYDRFPFFASLSLSLSPLFFTPPFALREHPFPSHPSPPSFTWFLSLSWSNSSFLSNTSRERRRKIWYCFLLSFLHRLVFQSRKLYGVSQILCFSLFRRFCCSIYGSYMEGVLL